MKDLKTLKDLPGDNLFEDNTVYISVDRLKEEAIKWAKFIQRTPCNSYYGFQESLHYLGDCTACSEGVGGCGKDTAITWIMDFFDLTEEDLK